MFKAGSLRSRIPHNFDPRAIYRVGVLEQATNNLQLRNSILQTVTSLSSSRNLMD